MVGLDGAQILAESYTCDCHGLRFVLVVELEGPKSYFQRHIFFPSCEVINNLPLAITGEYTLPPVVYCHKDCPFEH